MGLCLSLVEEHDMEKCDICYKELDKIYHFCPICKNRYHEYCIIKRHNYCCHQPTNRKDRGRPSLRESKIEENLSKKY